MTEVSRPPLYARMTLSRAMNTHLPPNLSSGRIKGEWEKLSIFSGTQQLVNAFSLEDTASLL
jgi:hypothetical protein